MTKSGAGHMPSIWSDHFPGLCGLDDRAWQALAAASKVVTLPAGAAVFRPGDVPHHYLLVLEGKLRVQTLTESGKEIVLYRVAGGESCVLTTSCLLASERFPAEAIAETAVRAVLLPAEPFRKALASSPGFREFALSAFAKRLTALIGLVQEVAFGRLPARLGLCLIENADADNRVIRTHQQLATELGTAREVVSRQLKELERRGWVKLHRGTIDILDPEALRQQSRERSS